MPGFLSSKGCVCFQRAHFYTGRLSFFLILLLLIVPLFHCQRGPESADDVKTEKDVAAFLDRLEKRYEAACIRMGEANWSLYSGQDPVDLNGVRAEFADLLLDSLNRKIISHWRYVSEEEVDPELRRRLEVWTQCLLGAYAEEDEDVYTLEHLIERRNQGFRFLLDGNEISRAELNQILLTEPDAERRRRAWETFARLSI